MPAFARDGTGASHRLLLARDDHGPVIGRLITCEAFVIGASVWAGICADNFSVWIALAAGAGAYLALNIGANNVANNIGLTVGARVLPLWAGLAIVATSEGTGALIAGADLVGTVRKDITDPALITDTSTYVWAMMAALLAAALWMNFATILGALVSTTHFIVGGVMGACAAGFGVVNWGAMGGIVASWMTSPTMEAVLAASCLYRIKRRITYHRDILGATRRGVAVLAAAMAWASTICLMPKSLAKFIEITLTEAALSGHLVAAGVGWVMRLHVSRRLPLMRNCKSSINWLLGMPLVFAAASMSFAHGSNDVANAIRPLAEIVDVLASSEISDTATIPLWVMALGAAGLTIGLALFDPKVIRAVATRSRNWMRPAPFASSWRQK